MAGTFHPVAEHADDVANRFELPIETPVVDFQQSVSVQPLANWCDLDDWHARWESVLQDSASSSIFSTPEWLEAHWVAYGQGTASRILLFLAARQNVVGFAWLFSERTKSWLGKKLRRLSFVGDGSCESAYLDVITRRGFEQPCAKALLDSLSSQRDWDFCELNTIADSSLSLTSLLAELSARRWKYRILRMPASSIPLPDTWEKYLALIPKRERQRIRHRTKVVHERFSVSFTKCADEADLPPALDVLFELHQKRWKQKGLAGTFSDLQRRDFYERMARSFLRKGWLEFWNIALEGKPVASLFAFRYQDKVHVLQKGMDPDYLDLSVGYVLEAYVIQTLIAQGVRCYDYLRGAEESKRRMGAQLGYYSTLQFARPASLGALHLTVDEFLSRTKDWLRNRLSSAALARIKGIYRRFSGNGDSASLPIDESPGPE